MKMADMKRPKPKKSDLKSLLYPDSDRYAWGLRLRCEKEELEKLPALGKLDVGDEVDLCCKAKVVSKSASASESHKSESMEFQVLEMGMEDPESFDSGYEKDD